MGMLGRGGVLATVTLAVVCASGAVAGAKPRTVPDAAYAGRICGEIEDVLAPLVELRGVDHTDLAAYQGRAVDLLADASQAAEDARDSLAKVTSKSGGKQAARAFEFFFRERADAYEAAGREIEDGDPEDPGFQSDVRAFVDVLGDAPFGLANPFDATAIAKKKALAKAFDADPVCVAVRVEFD